MKSKRLDGSCRCGSPLFRKCIPCGKWAPTLRVTHRVVSISYFFIFVPLLYGFTFVSEVENARGNRYYKRGQVGKARAAYQNALKAEPAEEAVAYNLGNAYFKETAVDKAIESYKMAVKAQDRPALQASAFYNLGNSLVRRKDEDRAIEFYKQALRLNPKDDDAKYNLELLLKRKKDNKQNQPNQQDRQDQQDQKKEDKNEPNQQNQGGGGQDEQGERPQGQEEQQSSPASQEQTSESESEKEKQDEREKQEEDQKTAAQLRAERLLNALEEQERQVLKSKGGQKNNRGIQRPLVEKDW
ncbi:MAG: tetratricopeptide repeat protein [Candidatus Omnitrophica bacterium]|nr:tetratricopeptide repeat protein [Candidatus Omnitrophota bacterium]